MSILPNPFDATTNLSPIVINTHHHCFYSIQPFVATGEKSLKTRPSLKSKRGSRRVTKSARDLNIEITKVLLADKAMKLPIAISKSQKVTNYLTPSCLHYSNRPLVAITVTVLLSLR